MAKPEIIIKQINASDPIELNEKFWNFLAKLPKFKKIGRITQIT